MYAGDYQVSIEITPGTTNPTQLQQILTNEQNNGHIQYVIDPTGTAGNELTLDGAPTIAVDYTPAPISGVPEPATFALIGFGLIGLAGLRKRFSR